MERGQAIVLIGFMGAGKSSIGRTLSRRTGLPVFDTDSIIANRFGLSIAEIFSQHGEEEFRRAESDALAEIPKQPAIVVTGGGLVLRPENVEAIRRLGTVIHLHAGEDVLFERASRRRTRPLLQTEDPRATFRQLLAGRGPLYEKAADLTLDTTRLTHEAVAEAALREIENLRENVA